MRFTQLIILLFILIAALFFNCFYFLSEKPEYTSSFEQLLAAQDTAIVFERSQCNAYGSIYRVTINGDGNVIYEWTNSVSYNNIVKRKIKKKTIKQLIKYFRNEGFFQLKDTYLSSDYDCKKLTKNQTIITIIVKVNNNFKKVKHYLGCQGFDNEIKLLKIESFIEKYLKIKR